jgi:hypothetical protein
MGATAIGASGSVKYVYDLSGYAETVLSLRQTKIAPEDMQSLPSLCRVRGQLVPTLQSIVQDTIASTNRPRSLDADRSGRGLCAQGADCTRSVATWRLPLPRMEQARTIAIAQAPELQVQLNERSALPTCTRRRSTTAFTRSP